MRSRSLVIVAGLLSLLGIGRASTVIFDQTTNMGGGGGNGVGLDIVSFRVADGFRLMNPSTVQGVNFEFAFFSGGDILSLGPVTYAFYNNNAGAVGTLIDTIHTVSASRVLDQTTCSTCVAASFNLATSLNLNAATTYFLEIHSGSTLNDNSAQQDVAWITANGPIVALYSDNSSGTAGLPDQSSGLETAFRLTGVTIAPEPGTAGLLLLGVSLLAIATRRRGLNKHRSRDSYGAVVRSASRHFGPAGLHTPDRKETP